MSWLATPPTPRPPLAPSLAKLLCMGALTASMGSAEMVLLLGHVALRNALPSHTVTVPRGVPCSHRSSDSGGADPNSSAVPVSTAAAVTEQVSGASNDSVAAAGTATPSIPCPLCHPHSITVDNPLADHLLSHALRLKRLWARSVLQMYGVHVSFEDRNALPDPVTGKSNPLQSLPLGNGRGPYLFLHLNQTSLLESVVLQARPPAESNATPFPHNVFMNWEFALLPFIGWNLRMTGISIDRADPVNAKAGADAVVHAMREQGHSFFMSVEGRRSEDGGLQPFKHGAAVMAIRAGATIVPVITHGVREALPFGDWRVRAGSRVRVVYERAIPTVGLTLADRHRLTQQLWNIAVRELTPPGMQVPEHLRLAQRPKLSSSSSSSRGKSGATKESPSQQQQSTLQLPSAL